jgi:hypothetical protein
VTERATAENARQPIREFDVVRVDAGFSPACHEFADIGEIGNGTVVAILDVHYRCLDGRELNLPCCNVFRVSDGLVRDYRIYMDVNPVIAP